MIFVDSGYLIALSNPRDELNGRATRWSRGVRGRVLTTDFVLLEVVNHLSAHVWRGRAQALIEWVRADQGYTIVRAGGDLLDAGFRLHVESDDKEWSLTDCISFHVMREHGVRQALAFDHHFEQAGFEALLRRDP